MRQASVADLRNKFTRISKWIEAGETVEITKRGQVFATLKPASEKRRVKANKQSAITGTSASLGPLASENRMRDS
jgi:antitoxin (DNA-binding transcriptional repressor) of toxin-antitoxin stability system